MKKTTLFLSLFASGLAMVAQPTITSADLPVANQYWAEMEDETGNPKTISAPGANQNWDYSTGYYTVTDTSFTGFIAPSAVPNNLASNFSAANLANYNATDSVAAFFVSNSNGFYYDGFYIAKASGIGKVDYDPNMLYVPTPFTYNSTRVNTGRQIIMFNTGLFNVKQIRNTKQSFTGDAYGTIKTPAGTFNDVLRIHAFEYSYDSVFADFSGSGNYALLSSAGPADTVNRYIYYSGTQNAPVAIFETEGPAGAITDYEASYSNFTLQPSSIAKTTKQESVSVYPNPAINQPVVFNFQPDSKASILNVYASNGQLVLTQNVSGFTKAVIEKIGRAHV